MKLSDLHKVNDLYTARHGLELQVAALDDGELTVTVPYGARRAGIIVHAPGSTTSYADRQMVAAVAPSVRSELQRRLDENAATLASLGVEVDGAPARA